MPPHFHVATHLPILDLLSRCEVLITHGGFTSVKEAMSRGVPMVVIPIASDQHYSADRCAALGLAEAVTPNQRTADRIRDATRMVLADPVYRSRAHEMAAQMAALPRSTAPSPDWRR